MAIAVNKKGIALLFDVLIGTGVLAGVIVLAIFLMSRGSVNDASQYQLARIGADILSILDQQHSFDELDHTLIEQKIQDVLPAHLDMLVRIEGDFDEGGGTIEVGGELPSRKALIPVHRVVLTSDDIYLKITAYVWLR